MCLRLRVAAWGCKNVQAACTLLKERLEGEEQRRHKGEVANENSQDGQAGAKSRSAKN